MTLPGQTSNITPVIVGEIGSYAHGLAREDSDHDYIGIYLEPLENLLGLAPSRGVIRERDQAEGVKSQPGDTEITFYPLRKYVAEVVKGNPTMLTMLFTPSLTWDDEIGIQKVRDKFLSRRIATTHVGYADSMYLRLTGEKAPRTNRPELIEAHGYDTKAAFHAIRLLMQGAEVMNTGRMTMPCTPVGQSYLMKVRNGGVGHKEALETIRYWREVIDESVPNSPLPERPDVAAIDRWLIRTYSEAFFVTHGGSQGLSCPP